MQLPAHVIPSAAQRLLPQGFVELLVQVPEPLQTDAVVTLPPVQLAGVQTVVLSGDLHVMALVPSHWALHLPVPPQAARGLIGSPVTTLHLPTEPDCLHDWHWPSHLPSQQTPSTQFPDVHCAAAEQLAPLSSVFAHVPVESQYVPAVHEVAVQLPEHLPLPSVAHRLLVHGLVVAIVQAPEPLHTDALVALPAVQLAAVQTVLLSGNAQAIRLVPSHCPLQVPVPPHAVRVARGAPFNAVHFPSELASLQDSHWPSHFPSQQTPSAQYPDAHEVPEEQLAPFGCPIRHTPVVSQ